MPKDSSDQIRSTDVLNSLSRAGMSVCLGKQTNKKKQSGLSFISKTSHSDALEWNASIIQ